jgi:TolB-like protein
VYGVLLEGTARATPAFTLPERPLEDESLIPRLSFVVLPFANLSADPEQEYFAHGLTDDLTTDLSLWVGSFVIARSTALTYKGKAVDAKRIGRELRVRYVVEGSVRRSNKRVRVGVQLTDTESGSQIWADRFDRDVADLFEMQDEITGRISIAIHYKLTDVERRRAERTNNSDALDLVFRGYAALYKRDSKTTLTEARGFFEGALQIDNRNTRAWAGLSAAHAADVLHRWSDAPTEQLRAAEETAAKALACNPTSPDAHMARAAVLFAQTRLQAALDEYAMVIELGGSYPFAYARMGILNAMLGRPEETSQLVERAIRLSPRDSNIGEWYLYIGVARFMTDQLEEAIFWMRRSPEAYPELAISYCVLASALSLTGHHEEAGAALSKYLHLLPNMTISKLRTERYSNHSVYLAWLERLYEGLRKAGLPE